MMRKKGLTLRELASCCNYLYRLLASGISLLDSLRIMQSLSSFACLTPAIDKISAGEGLSQAFEGCFPEIMLSSIAAAEQAGNLESVLQRLAKYYEERAEAEAKIKGALIYPMFVIGLCLASLALIFFFVLPGFKEMFADLDADLPLVTLILLGLGDFLAKFWYLLIIAFTASFFALIKYIRTTKGQAFFDQLFLRSKLYAREQISQCFRTLGSLLMAGVPIIAALETILASIKNQTFKKIIMELKAEVENGARFSAVLVKQEIFPREACQMIEVGENSGQLDQMLLSVADFLERERDVFIKRFTSLLEPALTLFVGLVVGVIALAMFLPMIDMISKLQ